MLIPAVISYLFVLLFQHANSNSAPYTCTTMICQPQNPAAAAIGVPGRAGERGAAGQQGIKGEKGDPCLCDVADTNFVNALRVEWSQKEAELEKMKQKLLDLEEFLCNKPLGLADRTIPDSGMTASSAWHNHPFHLASTARLDVIGCWAPDSGDPVWIQIDLGRQRLVSGVISQGRPNSQYGIYDQWMRSYKVKYGSNATDLVYVPVSVDDQEPQTFIGNDDRTSKVKNMFSEPVKARIIRIYPTHRDNLCVRLEILGC